MKRSGASPSGGRRGSSELGPVAAFFVKCFPLALMLVSVLFVVEVMGSPVSLPSGLGQAGLGSMVSQFPFADEGSDEGKDDSSDSDGSDSSGDSGAPLGKDRADSDLRYYYYHQLDSDDREKYDEMYRALVDRGSVEFPLDEKARAQYLYDCVLADHPEIFYLDGYRTVAAADGGATPAKISGSYSYTSAEIEECAAALDAVVDDCLAGIPRDADDYQTAKCVYDYVVRHVEYDAGLIDLSYEDAGQTVVNALLDGRAVCAGYARAYQMIMQELGYSCAYVRGVVDEGGEAHGWCLIELDGDYYYIDPTWGDPTYFQSGDGWDSDWVSYSYFCVDDEVLFRERSADDWQILPKCKSRDNTYFAREKLLFSNIDEEGLGDLIGEMSANGVSVFQFACAKDSVFSQVEAIFKDGINLPDGVSCRYVADEAPRVFTVSIEGAAKIPPSSGESNGFLAGNASSFDGDAASGSDEDAEPSSNVLDLSTVPAWSGGPYVEVNGGVPSFSDEDKERGAFEEYAALDSLGRCGEAFALIGLETMPTEERGNIGMVKPSGWVMAKYDWVDGKYLYNRCHLIGFQLAGENANVLNLITGTRFMNVEGMLPFENLVANYVEDSGNHVLYRVTPLYEGDNLVASGVLMEAFSVEDDGAGICFSVYVYNAQPGVVIDYATGESWPEG